MSNNNMERTFFIILVPVILVVILLNSGFLQARVPAVTVSGVHYNVSEFNYYYFTALNEYTDLYFDENGENGPFDLSVSLDEQTRDDGTTWQDYFTQLAEERMIEVIYYNEKAEEAGYEYSDEELAPIQEQLDYIEADRLQYDISLSNYLIAYWGVGMSEDVYTAELTKDVQADAYAAYLAETIEVTDDEISAWIAENDPDDYTTVNLTVIVLYAAADRFTEEVEEQQLSDLSEKLDRLLARYEADPSDIDALAAAFNDDEDLAAALGVWENAMRDDLPDMLSEWAYDEARAAGDYAALFDEENCAAYLVIWEGEGEEAAVLTAIAALRQQSVEDEIDQLVEEAEITYNILGKQLIGR